MDPLDFLYYSLGIGFIILVISVSFVAYQLARMLNALKTLISGTKDIAEKIRAIKNIFKSVLLNIGRLFLKKKEVER